VAQKELKINIRSNAADLLRTIKEIDRKLLDLSKRKHALNLDNNIGDVGGEITNIDKQIMNLTKQQRKLLLESNIMDKKKDLTQLGKMLDEKARGRKITIDIATTGMDTLKKGFSTMDNAIKGFGRAAGYGGALNMVNRQINNIRSNVGRAVDRFDTMNNAVTIFENLGVEAGHAERTVGRIGDALVGLPTALDAALPPVQKLLGAFGDIDFATDGFLALNNAVIAGGSAVPRQTAAIQQFIGMLSQDEPQMQRWTTLLEVMPAQLYQIGQHMGYANPEQLRVAWVDGEIGARDMIQAMIDLNQEGSSSFPSFERQARDASAGVRTNIANMEIAIVRGLQNAIGSIDLLFAQSDRFYGLGDAIAQFGRAIERMLINLGENLLESGDGIVDVFGNVIDFIENVDLAGLISGWVSSVSSFMGTLIGIVETIGSAFSGLDSVGGTLALLYLSLSAMSKLKVGTGILSFMTFLGGGEAAIAKVGKWKTALSGFKIFLGGLKGALALVAPVGLLLGAGWLLYSFWDPIDREITELNNRIRETNMEIRGTIDTLNNAISDNLSRVGEIQAPPSRSNIERHLRILTVAVENGINYFTPSMLTVLQSSIDAINEEFETFTLTIENITGGEFSLDWFAWRVIDKEIEGRITFLRETVSSYQDLIDEIKGIANRGEISSSFEDVQDTLQAAFAGFTRRNIFGGWDQNWLDTRAFDEIFGRGGAFDIANMSAQELYNTLDLLSNATGMEQDVWMDAINDLSNFELTDEQLNSLSFMQQVLNQPRYGLEPDMLMNQIRGLIESWELYDEAIENATESLREHELALEYELAYQAARNLSLLGSSFADLSPLQREFVENQLTALEGFVPTVETLSQTSLGFIMDMRDYIREVTYETNAYGYVLDEFGNRIVESYEYVRREMEWTVDTHSEIMAQMFENLEHNLDVQMRWEKAMRYIYQNYGDEAARAVENMGVGMLEAIEHMITETPEYLQRFQELLTESAGDWRQYLIDEMAGMPAEVIEQFITMSEGVESPLDYILKHLQGTFDSEQWEELFASSMRGGLQGFRENWPDILQYLQEQGVEIPASLKTMLGLDTSARGHFYNAFGTAGGDAVDGFEEGFSTFNDFLRSQVDYMYLNEDEKQKLWQEWSEMTQSSMVEPVTDILNKKKGEDIIDDFTDGILGQMSARSQHIFDGMTTPFVDVLSEIRGPNIFDTRSPSRTMYNIGRNVIQGIMNGVNALRNPLINLITTIANEMSSILSRIQSDLQRAQSARNQMPSQGNVRGFQHGGHVGYYANGGPINFKRRGTDTVPAMLTPGEYVHKRSSVNLFGKAVMDRINNRDVHGTIDAISKRFNTNSLTTPNITNLITNTNSYDNKRITFNTTTNDANALVGKIGRYAY